MTDVPPIHYARTVDGLYIAYQDVGTGTIPLVFFNGMYSHIEVYWEWPQFARFVSRLATRLRVLHFDRRGTGMSDRVTDVPTLEHSLDDINAVLATAGVERAAIYGWGEAAPLAALFAATYPEKTVAVLLDGPLRLKWAPDYPWGTSLKSGGMGQAHSTRSGAGTTTRWRSASSPAAIVPRTAPGTTRTSCACTPGWPASRRRPAASSHSHGRSTRQTHAR